MTKKSPKLYEETHKIIDDIEHKQCLICENFYPMNKEYFYKNKSSPDKYNSYCKDCTKKKSSKWEKENQEKYKITKKKYNDKPESKIKHKARTERWRKKGKLREWQKNNYESLVLYAKTRSSKKHEISNDEWESCKDYFDHSCAYCGITEDAHKEMYKQQLHKEHVDHEGANDLSNCVPACKICNLSKWTFEYINWYNEGNEHFTYERQYKINKWLNEDYKLHIE